MRTKLTSTFVQTATAEPGADRSVFWDETLPGFGLMVTKSGHRSWVYQYRAANRSRRMTFPFKLGIDKARQEAKKALGGVAGGKDPLQERRKAAAEAQNTLQSICEEYIRREGKRLRSSGRMDADLKRLVYPKLGKRQIDSIRRSEIVRLLDKIEDERGPAMATRVLADIRKIMNWHAARSDDFRSPIVRGMARTKPAKQARERILADNELKAVWKAAENATGPFEYLVRFILLTATRRNETARMADPERTADDWIIPGSRYKTKLDHVIPLSQVARDLLAKVPRVKNVKFVFTTGETAISGFSKFKKDFDKAVTTELRKRDPEAKPLPRWTLHDLRRTARSLMSRAGVDADHAERCLGHVIGGVRGTYDRYEYLAEKKQAFEALASQIDQIVNLKDNVIPFKGDVSAEAG